MYTVESQNIIKIKTKRTNYKCQIFKGEYNFN